MEEEGVSAPKGTEVSVNRGAKDATKDFQPSKNRSSVKLPDCVSVKGLVGAHCVPKTYLIPAPLSGCRERAHVGEFCTRALEECVIPNLLSVSHLNMSLSS